MICLGARLGGEVRAFKTLGAIAIGIDLNPGKDSMDVLAGDYYNIGLPNNSLIMIIQILYNLSDSSFVRFFLAPQIDD